MSIQIAPDELTRIAKFVNDLNVFVLDNKDIIDVETAAELSFDFYDSNGDKLGVITTCDWGEYGFVPGFEIEL